MQTLKKTPFGLNDYRSQIACLTHKLQHQKKVPLWMIANENVITSIAVGETPTWGPKSQKLRQVINIAYRCKVIGFVIFFIGLAQSIAIYRQARKSATHPVKRNIQRVFAGFGANMEERLYEKFLKQADSTSLRINWATGQGLSTLNYPEWTAVIGVLLRYSFRCAPLLRNSEKEISTNIVDFLTISASNIGFYAFYYPYWIKAKLAGVKEVVFIAPFVPAFACVDARINTVFQQHGLLALGILFPQIARMDILTEEEADYFRKLLKTIPIHVEKKSQKIRTVVKNKNLVVLSPTDFSGVLLKRLHNLIDWSKQHKLKVIMRPAPTLNQAHLSSLLQQFPGAELDKPGTSFAQCLETWNPQYVASLWSTGLIEALDYGCLPISVCDPVERSTVWRTIYPLAICVLFWPRDQSEIESTVESEIHYQNKLEMLRHTQDDCFNEIGYKDRDD